MYFSEPGYVGPCSRHEKYKSKKTLFEIPKFDLQKPKHEKLGYKKRKPEHLKFELPKHDAFEYKKPKFEVPKHKKPRIVVPKFEKQKHKRPKFDLPKFDFLKFDLPKHLLQWLHHRAFLEPSALLLLPSAHPQIHDDTTPQSASALPFTSRSNGYMCVLETILANDTYICQTSAITVGEDSPVEDIETDHCICSVRRRKYDCGLLHGRVLHAPASRPSYARLDCRDRCVNLADLLKLDSAHDNNE
ncbi:hypothetical protein Mp_1g00040 [Marchantia polymorpha subsp. ruderalis]|uniref:Uncharacterized protein n=1 Tax=Marchantia polymorpha subsp. ruderalis TaxID=1480154 RepID=A0AAF6AJT5_MARPO|nr:hypothetical protein Mp_1g00040 [Marchantia polymorpha subsp. ruderalis]